MWEASAAFGEVLKTLERGDRVAALKSIDELRSEYGSSRMRSGDLLGARVHVDTREFGKAIER